MFSCYFRFVAATVLFLLSLMVVLPATELVFWYLVILATEFGHWFSLASLGLMGWEMLAQRRPVNWLVMALCLASAGLFLTPLVQAMVIARKLPAELSAALGPTVGANGASPLSFPQLLGLTTAPTAQSESRRFTTKDGTELPLTVFHDGSPGPCPCIVMIHGGGWNTGDEKQLPAWNLMLARLGYRVAAISYRLAPKAIWPAQKEDVAAALAYLKVHAGEFGIDPQRFILLGRSAGGQIALDVAYTLHDPAIRGCIASYAPTDMNFAYWTGQERDIIGSRPLVRGLMGGPPASSPEMYHDASPLNFVDASTPRTLLIHGTRDEIVWVRHSERLRDRMIQAGRPVFLLELPWATHGFDFPSRGPGSQLELYAIAWFLKSDNSK